MPSLDQKKPNVGIPMEPDSPSTLLIDTTIKKTSRSSVSQDRTSPEDGSHRNMEDVPLLTPDNNMSKKELMMSGKKPGILKTGDKCSEGALKRVLSQEEQKEQDQKEANERLSKDPPFTWKSFLIVIIFVTTIIAQSVVSRKLLKDTKVFSQSITVMVGVCACILYGNLSIWWSYVYCREDMVEDDEDDSGNTQQQSCHTENGDRSQRFVVKEKKFDTVAKRFRFGVSRLFDVQKIWWYFPSAILFSVSQSLMIMAPLFVGPGMRNMFAQVKIPLSVVTAQFLLGKKHNVLQWLSVLILTCSVACFGVLQGYQGGGAGGGDKNLILRVMGFAVVLLGSIAAVGASTLQELRMKTDMKVSVFVQKFQTDITQVFISIGIMFLLPYLGMGLDSFQSGMMKAGVLPASTEPQNIYLKQDMFTYKAKVVTVNNYEKTIRQFFNEDLTAFISEEGGCAPGDVNCERMGNKFFDDFLTNMRTQKVKKPSNEKGASKGELKEECITCPKDREFIPTVKKLKSFAKQLKNLEKTSVGSPFKSNLRIIHPDEWKNKIVIGGNSVSKKDLQKTTLIATVGEKPIYGDIRGVYELTDQNYYCNFEQLKNKHFVVKGCLSGSKLLLPNQHHALVVGKKKDFKTELVAHWTEVQGLNDEHIKKILALECGGVHSYAVCANTKFDIGHSYFSSGFQIRNLKDARSAISAEIKKAQEAPRSPKHGLLQKQQKPIVVDYTAEPADFQGMKLEIRRGPIAPGVAYSQSYNSKGAPGQQLVCDNLACAPELMETYKWQKDQAWYKEAHNGFIPGSPEYESGFTAGWSSVILYGITAQMCQYFLNAVVNKNLSVVWNKVAHSLATVLSFWLGEMLFEQGDNETDTMKLFMLAVLSISVFSNAMMLLFAKQFKRKEE